MEVEKVKQAIVAVALLAAPCTLMAQAPPALPPGYWTEAQSSALLAKTQTLRLAPDLGHLSSGEREAVTHLLDVGRIFQGVYEQQRHARAAAALAALMGLDKQLGSPTATRNLLDIYRLSQGPIATTLDNKREAFLPVELTVPGAAMYDGVPKAEIDSFIAAHPAQRDRILDPRTAVRRATPANLQRDLSRLSEFPVLDALHPGLRAELQALNQKPDVRALYAVPYSLAFAEEMVRAHAMLNRAADAVQSDDWELARYLRNRARDLLSDDYESGDASWVTGRFKNLNAQIGAYETYDDALYGVKTFFGFSLMATRRAETDRLREAMTGLQALEDSLPYNRHKRVREDIPIGVYDVVADFGQARGGNTATILPNDAFLAQRYGRTILLRANILRSPELFEGTGSAWRAAVDPRHATELTVDGNFYRTLWHEIGHYLGVDRTLDGREIDLALQENADLLEEMKADLVALYAAETLRARGYYTDAQLRSVYASGIRRVLQNNKPRRDQPYQTMQLMQWNFFLQNGLLIFDRDAKRLRIDYDRYHDVAGKLLARVLEVQAQGDKAAAERFVEQYTQWDESLHGAIAASMRSGERYRFRLYRYAALGE
jgi:hypothetical protein